MNYDDDAVPFNPHTKPHPAAVAALNAVTRVLANPEIKGASILLRAANIALRYAPRLPEDPLPPGREQRYENTIRALLEELGSRSDPKRKTPLPSTIDEALASVLKHMSDFESETLSCFSKQKHVTQNKRNPGGTGVTRSVSPVSCSSSSTQPSGTAVPAVSTSPLPASCPPPSPSPSPLPSSSGATEADQSRERSESPVPSAQQSPSQDHGRAASGVTPVPPGPKQAAALDDPLWVPLSDSRSTRAP